MNLGQTVFAQLMEFIPSYEFQLCVHAGLKEHHFCRFDEQQAG
jgi:hypothetical protein